MLEFYYNIIGDVNICFQLISSPENIETKFEGKRYRIKLWQGYILETLPHVLEMGYTAVNSTFKDTNLKEKVWSRNKLKTSRD